MMFSGIKIWELYWLQLRCTCQHNIIFSIFRRKLNTKIVSKCLRSPFLLYFTSIPFLTWFLCLPHLHRTSTFATLVNAKEYLIAKLHFLPFSSRIQYITDYIARCGFFKELCKIILLGCRKLIKFTHALS